MQNDNPIQDLINRWPTRGAFAEEVGANLEAVYKWPKSGRIPSAWQAAVLKAAVARGMSDITPEWMLEVHSQKDGATT